MTDADLAQKLMGIEYKPCASCEGVPPQAVCAGCAHNRKTINALVSTLTQVFATVRIEIEGLSKL